MKRISKGSKINKRSDKSKKNKSASPTKTYKKKASKEKTPKRLYRSRQDKIIAGVCGGIGEYLNIDPLWIRLVAILLVFAEGIGVGIYLLAWIIMPENPSQKKSKETSFEETAKKISKKESHKTSIFGILLIVAGMVIFLRRFFGWIDFSSIWPLLVIGLGFALLFKKESK